MDKLEEYTMSQQMTNHEAFRYGFGKMKDNIISILIKQSEPFIQKRLHGYELSDIEEAEFDQIKMLKDKIGRIETK